MESEEEIEVKWRGPSIDEMYNGLDLFERENQAPAIIESESHNVLFNLPLPVERMTLPVPKSCGGDKWDENHVRLPSSPSSVYAEIDESGNKSTKSRWQLITKCLKESPIKNSRDFEAVVKSYNTKQAQSWEFSSLHELFEDEFSEEDSDFFFENVLPNIIDLALRLPQLIQSPIPLLKKKQNHSISMSQEQCGCLLANAFLCTFPGRNVVRKNTDFPEINFNRLFSTKGEKIVEKIKCLLNYFKRICLVETPTGVLTFQRRFIEPATFPKWQTFDTKFSSIKLLVSSEGTIEDGTSTLQVDFANRYLGGGVLGWGCVQEEIRFVINPEMIIGMLFCESMKSEEAILMTGCEQFNKYVGYASSFKWNGNKIDTTQRDSFRRRMTFVAAIDALSFHKPHMQFEEFALKRELNKAYTGFFHDPKDDLSPIPVSSGNWGCGVFRGFKPLKALIQLMACCVNRRNLFYYTFGETELMDEIYEMFEWLNEKNVTVGQLWTYLQAFRKEALADRPEQLFKFIKDEHNRKLIHNEMNQSLAEMSSSDFEAEDEDEFCEQPKNESSDASEKESPRRSDESPVKHLSKKVKIEENSENQIFGLGNSVVIEIPETVVEGMTETTEMLACESLKQRDSSSLIINQSSVNESSSTKNLIEMKESSIDESSTIIDQSSSILNSPENNKILKITDFYKSK